MNEASKAAHNKAQTNTKSQKSVPSVPEKQT